MFQEIYKDFAANHTYLQVPILFFSTSYFDAVYILIPNLAIARIVAQIHSFDLAAAIFSRFLAWLLQ